MRIIPVIFCVIFIVSYSEVRALEDASVLIIEESNKVICGGVVLPDLRVLSDVSCIPSDYDKILIKLKQHEKPLNIDSVETKENIVLITLKYVESVKTAVPEVRLYFNPNGIRCGGNYMAVERNKKVPVPLLKNCADKPVLKVTKLCANLDGDIAGCSHNSLVTRELLGDGVFKGNVLYGIRHTIRDNEKTLFSNLKPWEEYLKEFGYFKSLT